MSDRSSDPSMHDQPTTEEKRKRRLLAHTFVQNPDHPSYPWCTYPDPGNAVSGFCGMSGEWHIRDLEERAAEDQALLQQANPGFTFPAPEVVADPGNGLPPEQTKVGTDATWCDVHSGWHREPTMEFTIVKTGTTGSRFGQEITIRVCAPVAISLGLYLP